MWKNHIKWRAYQCKMYLRGQLLVAARVRTSPTMEEFGRLDEKTASAITSLASKITDIAANIRDHVEEDRELKRSLEDQQRQFERMAAAIESLNRQLADIAMGFKQSVSDTQVQANSIKGEVEVLKKESEVRKAEEHMMDRIRTGRENRMRLTFSGIVALSAIFSIIIAHYWK